MVVPKIKICGITRLEDALYAASCGCDAIGFVFYRKSPRYIRPEEARVIRKLLPKRITTVGVFVNARASAVRRIAQECPLDMLQFHGTESPAWCAQFKHHGVIKAFRVKEAIDFPRVLRYDVDMFLFDSWSERCRGGTGRRFNWKALSDARATARPIVLSGGLTSRNVRRAIRHVNPAWVDVSSSVEGSPGKKDHKKIARFIAAVKRRHST